MTSRVLFLRNKANAHLRFIGILGEFGSSPEGARDPDRAMEEDRARRPSSGSDTAAADGNDDDDDRDDREELAGW